ncbi:MAG TPA: hypothetical protein VIU11_21505 [Nakamurella sp.]
MAVIAGAGLVVASGTASAAPVYVPPGLSAVSINVDQILVTGTNFGDVNGPDQSVTVTVSYIAPSGLRASAGLAAAAAASTSTVSPDADGNFSVIYDLTQDGDVWVRAVGSPSGDDLTVFLADPPGVPGSGSGTTGGKGYDSGTIASSGYASGGYSDLATTGANITAPLAIGIGALLAGLVLLFFGTRGVLRRRGVKSTTSN